MPDEIKPKLWKVTCTFQYVAYCKHEITAEMCATEAFIQARHYMGHKVEESTSKELPLGWTDKCVPFGPLHIRDKTIKQLRDTGDIT